MIRHNINATFWLPFKLRKEIKWFTQSKIFVKKEIVEYLSCSGKEEDKDARKGFEFIHDTLLEVYPDMVI